ncbi:hypothetical protein BFJ70_g1138 [Fusarium oxysporum]|nr:hypothetical protein BFJ70_g1138 [Fusarium oxysporum]
MTNNPLRKRTPSPLFTSTSSLTMAPTIVLIRHAQALHNVAHKSPFAYSLIYITDNVYKNGHCLILRSRKRARSNALI